MTADALPSRTSHRCSFAAERRGDPLPGTAAPAVGLLLVEQPGPWGRVALTGSRLDPAVGAAVAARAADAGIRTLVIRPPGRAAAEERSRRRWAVVDCRPGSEAIRWGWFERDAELLDLPLDGSAGETSADAAYLVCTHGRHDACCAIRGRPVSLALAGLRPGAVWECSHVGGDRFAANVVALPHGLYYGRVSVDRAEALVDAHERGEVLSALLRGRATFAPAAQAAQDHVRSMTGSLRIDDLLPVEVVATGSTSWRVRLAAGDGVHVVDVRSMAAGPPALLTCGAAAESAPPKYVVDSVRRES